MSAISNLVIRLTPNQVLTRPKVAATGLMPGAVTVADVPADQRGAAARL